MTENYMLQQMQQLAANMTALPQTGGSKETSEGSSFQELIDKASEKTETGTETSGKQPVDKKDPQAAEKEPAEAPKEDQEELKAENVTAAPVAASYMDLFRPEITPVEEEAVAAPITAEIPVVEEAAPEQEAEVDLPVMEAAAAVETPELAATAEKPETSFQEVLEDVPEQAETVEEVPVEQKAETAEPERAAVETAKETVREELPEVEIEVQEDSDEPKAEAMETSEPVFHDAKAAPVKVGETYETVDTQEPDMDQKLANTIQQAVQNGSERVEIRLTPENLGALTIEMTKDVSGVLQVVLHASNSRAAGLLSQHMDGLQAALQSYSQEPVRVEVQRNEESQQQNLHQQANPDGRGQNQQQRERREEHTDHGDFLQRMRLGLFGENL